MTQPDSAKRTSGTPRWVKVFAIAALGVVVLVVVLVIAGRGGTHGPRRHIQSADAGAPAANVPEGHAPPTAPHTQA